MSKFINFTVSDAMLGQIECIGEKHGHIHASSGRVNLSATLRYLLQVAIVLELQNTTKNPQDTQISLLSLDLLP